MVAVRPWRGIALPPSTIPALLGLAAVVLLFATPPEVVLALLVATVVVGAAAKAPEIALGLILASVPIQSLGSVAMAGTTLTWTKIVVLAAACGWLIRMAAGAGRAHVSGLTLAFGAYLLVLAMSVVGAREIGSWAGEVYRWGVAFFVFVLARDALSHRNGRTALLIASAVGAIGASAYGMYQSLTGSGPPSFTVNGVTRAFAGFGEPNPLAVYLEMTVPLMLAVVVFGERHRSEAGESSNRARLMRALMLVGVLTGTAALVLTQSRGGAIGFLTGVAVVIWLRGPAKWVIVMSAAAVVAMLIVGAFAWGRVDRAASTLTALDPETQVSPANFAVQERQAHWRAGLQMVKNHPWLGVGAGNFSVNLRESTTMWRFRISRGHAHNGYIHAAAQSGMIGLASYLVLWGVVVRKGWRAVRVAPDRDRGYAVGALAVTGAIAVHSLFDYVHVLSLGIQLAACWALLDVMARERFAHAELRPQAVNA